MTDFETKLRGVPLPPGDPAGAVAAAYVAGRRDGRSAAVPWRFAAGLLLATTLGLAASHGLPSAPAPRTPLAVERPVPPAIRPLRPHPSSVAVLRSNVLADGTVALPPSPPFDRPNDDTIPRAFPIF